MDSQQLIAIGKEVLQIEIGGLHKVNEGIGEEFAQVVKLLDKVKGHVIATGMGKSGIIAQKLASTLLTVGVQAVFMHPAEGLHGGLGIISKNDVVICISNSGETEELNKLLPFIKRRGAVIIAITGNSASTLANTVDFVLEVPVQREACPFNIIPTASTTAAMALCDALCIALLKLRNLKAEDFALIHPGGALGKRLFLRIEDLMHTGDAIPKVTPDTLLKDALFEITSKRFGATAIVDCDDRVLGIITDGDLRRLIERKPQENIWLFKVSQVMTKNPKTIHKEALAVVGLERMEHHAITQLLVVDEENKLIGIIHMHDLLKAKIV